MKLPTILLIDDNPADNYYHRLILNELEIGEEIVALESGHEALVYLRQVETQQFAKPDLIFLDINMPGMNGWEFLDEYRCLQFAQQASIPIYLLTTSANPKDREKAQTIKEIFGFLNKPITSEMMDGITKDIAEMITPM